MSDRETSPTETPDEPSTGRSARIRLLPIGVGMGLAVLGAFTLADLLSFETLHNNRATLLSFREQNYVGLAAAFMLVYVVIVAFSLPGAAVASVTGGFLFGLTMGTALNVLAATLGAMGLFLAARWGLGAALSARFDASSGRLQRLRAALQDNEIEVLLLLRLVPVVPFFVANLLPALVGVRPLNFLWTTAVGIVPGALVFTSIGDGLGEVFDRGARPDLSLLWEPQVIAPILGLCALALLPIVIKARRGNKGV